MGKPDQGTGSTGPKPSDIPKDGETIKEDINNPDKK